MTLALQSRQAYRLTATRPSSQPYLQRQLLDVSEQLDIFFCQVLVTGQFLVFISPIAAFLIV